ncbi:Ion-translocating oxidoreductase complex subunit G [Buchnera aphidicola (Eriosoma lanigerum)]|uniref:electron transport complex subunit RsxG n=1 Tax=Buchnera aphidicola TaxID=9 RepID=UPI003463F0F4
MFINNFKNSIILVMFAIFFSGFTAVVYKLTNNIIMQQDRIHIIKLLNEIVDCTGSNCCIIQDNYHIQNKILGDKDLHRFWLVKKKHSIYAFIIETTAPDGYSGDIKMLVASDLHGNIIGVRIIKHNETPGLGDKIDIHISNWITYFSGMNVLPSINYVFSIKKDGGIINQFTGATITPRAVTNAIRNTVVFIVHSLSSHTLMDIKGNIIYVDKKN